MANASTAETGKFIQGQLSTLSIRVNEIDGTPVDPDNISVTVLNSEGDIVTTDTPTKIDNGFYVSEWQITKNQPIGKYTIRWRYTIDSEETLEESSVVVSSSDNLPYASAYYSRRQDLISALEKRINIAQATPIYNEQAKETKDYKAYRFSFPRWNTVRGTKIYRNNNILNSGFEINYFTGEVIFDKIQTAFDVVKADYNFRWFSVDELSQYINDAISTLNTYAPHSQWDILRVPDRYLSGIIYHAAADAIRYLMLTLQWQEPQLVFGGPENARQMFTNLETLKKNYEEEWKAIFDNKKYGPYPRIGIVVTPEYSLPGGRSRWFRELFS